MKQNDKKTTNEYEIFIKLGIDYTKQGNNEKAIINFKEAIKINNKNYKAYINLANVYLLNNEIKKSTNLLSEYLKINKVEKNILNHLIKIYLKYTLFNELPKLFKFYKSNLLDKKDYYYLYFAEGLYFERSSNTKKAINSYKQSISYNPGFFDAYTKLLNLLELSNNIKDFEHFISLALNNFKNNKDIVYFNALLLNRQKKYQLSENLILKSKLENQFKDDKYKLEKLFNLQSRNNEKLNQFKIAYDKIFQRNILVKNYKENNNFNRFIIIDNINKYKTFYNKKNVYSINNKLEYLDDSNLVFLVSFPRSGTTLLDTILRTHSKITVLEEEPFLIEERHKFFRMKNNRLDALFDITQKEKDNIRESYLKKIKQKKDSHKNIIIDKLPLSIIELGFIKCIFPKSKTILAVRHPCDVVLSCFFSSFKINDAMVNFLNFDNTVSFYNDVFNLFEFYEKELHLNLHKIKYEDVVKSFESNIRNLLTFLKLDYEKSLENFYKTALNRNKISTPSYNQVINPLYSSSIGRWKNYKDYINPEKKLKKWIKKFNY